MKNDIIYMFFIKSLGKFFEMYYNIDMSKKAIIILSVVLGIIVTMLILFWTLFALSSVTVKFHTTTKNLALTEAEIVETGDFCYGASVLFDGKKKYVERLDEAVTKNENFAYLEVVNIETIFPNRYVIHVAEREEVFEVQYGENVLVLDDELRVLKIENAPLGERITLKNLTILNENVAVGDFLEVKEAGVLNLYNAFLENNRTLAEQKAFVKDITLNEYTVEITGKSYVSAKITTRSGREFVINNIDFALSNKIQLLFAVDCALYANIDADGNLLNEAGEVIFDYVLDENGNAQLDDDGNMIKRAWTLERLKNSYVLIDNFVLNDYVETAETDIFYRLMDKK